MRRALGCGHLSWLLSCGTLPQLDDAEVLGAFTAVGLKAELGFLGAPPPGLLKYAGRYFGLN